MHPWRVEDRIALMIHLQLTSLYKEAYCGKCGFSINMIV